jgi:N-acetylated-alpha-linked acidic dipeptidase
MHGSPDSKFEKAETALRLARPSKINSSAAYEVMMNRLARKYSAIVILAMPLLLPFASGKNGNGDIRGFFPERVKSEHELESKLQSIPDAAHAESNLRHLTSQPHSAGTEASHQVAEWLRDQYRSFGFEAEIVTYSVWMAEPREVKLELVAPSKKALASPEQPVDVDKDTADPRAVMAYNTYSPSGEVTAPVVYVNYGTPEDYEELDSLGVSVQGKIAIARYGHNYRGIKSKLAEEHKAAGLIIFSDPADDGYMAGDVFPRGPWRPMSGIQRGSVLYTEYYPGDPLTPGVGATSGAKRIAPADATNLPHILTMPINAQDAWAILEHLGGPHVPRNWQGGLPFTYHAGPGKSEVHMKLAMDFAQRPIYDVVAKLHGTDDGQWVLLGNHHDAWVYGAADPSSGTAVMLETARALGELARSGWKPRRTIVMCEWDGEEPGLLGSTEWVEANRAELQAKAVAYINTDVGVTGPNFGAAATPSLKELVREVAREVRDPQAGRSVYDMWREHSSQKKNGVTGTARPELKAETPGETPVGALGAGSDFCPFFDFAGIASMDMGFNGDYGVYHSLYDDFYWMKQFGDPTFVYHATLARIIGTVALRLDEADVLPFDYSVYATEITRMTSDVNARVREPKGAEASDWKAVSEAADQLSVSAAQTTVALRAISPAMLSPATQRELNRALASVEQSLLVPEGLAGRPWYKHAIFAPGSYAGYAAEVMPGVNEALDRNDPAIFHREASALAAALTRAAVRLDEVNSMAKTAAGTHSGQ